jgi:hypothetical protein
MWLKFQRDRANQSPPAGNRLTDRNQIWHDLPQYYWLIRVTSWQDISWLSPQGFHPPIWWSCSEFSEFLIDHSSKVLPINGECMVQTTPSGGGCAFEGRNTYLRGERGDDAWTSVLTLSVVTRRRNDVTSNWNAAVESVENRVFRCRQRSLESLISRRTLCFLDRPHTKPHPHCMPAFSLVHASSFRGGNRPSVSGCRVFIVYFGRRFFCVQCSTRNMGKVRCHPSKEYAGN